MKLHDPGFRNESAFAPDLLIAGETQIVSVNGTYAAGQGVIPRGAVLGVVSAAPATGAPDLRGQYKLSASAAADGSQTPNAIAVDEVDTTPGAKVAGVYVKGEFAAQKVTFGAGHTAATAYQALRDAGIFLVTIQEA